MEKAKSYRCGASFSLLVSESSLCRQAPSVCPSCGGDFDFGDAERGAVIGIAPLEQLGPTFVGAAMAPPRSRVGQAGAGFGARFPLSQSGQGMAPMRLAAAEAGGASRIRRFVLERRGWCGRSASEPRPLQKSVLRRAGAGPLASLWFR